MGPRSSEPNSLGLKLDELVGEETLREHVAVPLRVDDGRLVVAMRDPDDMLARAQLQSEAGLPLEVVAASEEYIRQALEKLFAPTTQKPLSPTASSVVPILPILQGGRVWEISPDPKAAGLLGEEAPQEHLMMPVRLENGLLIVAVGDLGDQRTLDAARAVSDYPLSFIEVAPADISRARNALLSRPAETPAEAPAKSEREKLLVVFADDDPDVLGLISRRLPKRGYELVTAVNGREALDAVRQHLPQAAVLDWAMPMMEGTEVCARLKADPKTADIPVLLFTGKGEEENIERGFEKGVDEYIIKPFDIIDLDDTIRRVVEEKRGRGVLGGAYW